MKKLMVIWFSSLLLFGCSRTVNSEETDRVTLTKATISSIDEDEITFEVLDPFEGFGQKNMTSSKEPVSLTYKINDDTLFLHNGNIIGQSDIVPGMNAIFSTEDDNLTVLEILSEE